MGCLLKQGGGLYPRLRIGAVLLAAGEGRRMGGVAKPLIRLQGVPLISRQLVALSGAGVDEVVVVTGYARAATEEAVRSFVVTLAHNDDYAAGQQGSVRVGLAALGGAFDAVIVMPADQPLIGASDLTELIGAFKKRPAGHVVVPVVNGQRGQSNRARRPGAGADSRERHEPRLPPPDRARAGARASPRNRQHAFCHGPRYRGRRGSPCPAHRVAAGASGTRTGSIGRTAGAGIRGQSFAVRGRRDLRSFAANRRANPHSRRGARRNPAEAEMSARETLGDSKKSLVLLRCVEPGFAVDRESRRSQR